MVPDALLWAAAASLGDWRTPGGRTYGWDDAPPVAASATERAVTACRVDAAEASIGWEVGWERRGTLKSTKLF